MTYYRKNKGIGLIDGIGLMASAFWHLPQVRWDEKHHFGRLLDFIRKLRISLGGLALAVSIGVAGYMWLEGFTFLEAYYMTIITLSTAGFMEVKPLTDAGRIFTTFLLIFNLGIFTFAISSLSSLFSGGRFQHILLDLHMIDKISKLEFHHIVCGFGRHGQQVASEFRRQNMPFVVIENNASKIQELREHFDYLYLEGDATDDDLLLEAGIKKANSIVLTLPDDADNLFTVMTAKQLNEKIRTISRSTNERDEMKLKRAGADFVILPEKLGGFYMATLVKNPNLVEFFTLVSHLEGSGSVFEEFDCARLPTALHGKTIKETGLFDKGLIQVLAVRKPNGQYELNPNQDSTRIEPGKFLVLFGDLKLLKFD
jgi:voltage-gated potassium channel